MENEKDDERDQEGQEILGRPHVLSGVYNPVIH
jgi:hypothetical protein